MNDPAARSRALRVSTRTADDLGDLLTLTGARDPLVFLRDGDGLIGVGEALRVEVSGASRISEAAAWWRDLVAGADIEDAVRVPGSGLVAFGTLAFADDSAEPSVLVVPRLVIGRRHGISWITTIDPVADSSLTPRAEPLGTHEPVTLHEGEQSGAGYAQSVAAAITAIGDGKVVLARDLVGAVPTDADIRSYLARLAEAHPESTTYAVDGMIGASPETLVRVFDGEVRARVLAGSAARGADDTADALAALDLSRSTKDVREHGFARASVLDALAPHAAELAAGEPRPLRLPNLWHLASDVSGRVADGSSSLDLVAALHPTAAVGGTPLAEALRLIAELEPFDRGRYAGPVGWIDGDGDGEWAIALRGAQITGGTVRAIAGAGIVAGSDPQAELAETELKFRPIVDALRA